MSYGTPAEALTRPAGGSALSSWDDFPVHQTAAPLGAVAPPLPGWAERFYFNLLRPSGELAGIIGGGIYPLREASECYFCRLDGDRQVNVRAWQPLVAPGAEQASGPFSFRCDVPLSDWSVTVDIEDARFAGRFKGAAPPYLYELLDIPADEPGGDFDLYRHFVAMGRWELDEFAGEDPTAVFIGARDRTWGIRSRRIRLHNWYVLQLGETCLTLIHQELADGSVFFSEAGAVHPDGRVERLEVRGHDLRYDADTREVIEGSVDLMAPDGRLLLEFERVGTAIRLAGAGYDDSQGDRGVTGAVDRDEYDLGDPDVASRTGRGTLDTGARARASGVWEAEGIGVVETAVARNHARYGQQIR